MLLVSNRAKPTPNKWGRYRREKYTRFVRGIPGWNEVLTLGGHRDCFGQRLFIMFGVTDAVDHL